jgi:hypothetical protein
MVKLEGGKSQAKRLEGGARGHLSSPAHGDGEGGGGEHEERVDGGGDSE